MSDATRISASLLSSETNKWAWDIQELDPEDPHLYQHLTRYVGPFRSRLQEFLSGHVGDVVYMDATSVMAKFMVRCGYGTRSEYCTLEVPTTMLKCIKTFFDRGGFADLSISDYLKAMT